MKRKKKFSWRGFVTFGLFFSFFLMTLSGVILYIAPPGRIAHWSEWTLWGLSKEGWQSLHTNFSLMFLILGIFHLFSINWKAFLGHIRSRVTRELNRKWEMITSTLLTLAIFFGVIWNVPPFKTIMDWGEQFTESWEEEDNTPPIPHAELYTLTDFSKEILKMSPDSVRQVLSSHNIRVDSMSQTIKEIGTANGLAPSGIYALFGKSDDQVEQQRQEAVTIPGGNGIGRKTLRQIGDEFGIPPAELVSALKKKGIEVTEEDALKDIATANGMSPADILDILNHRDEQ